MSDDKRFDDNNMNEDEMRDLDSEPQIEESQDTPDPSTQSVYGRPDEDPQHSTEKSYYDAPNYQAPPSGQAYQAPYGQGYQQPYQAPYGQQHQTPYAQPYGYVPPSEVLLMEYPGQEKRLVRLASRGARFGAYLIDSIICGIPSTILAIIIMVNFFNNIFGATSPLWGNVNPITGEMIIDERFIEANWNFFANFFIWMLILVLISLVIQVVYYGLIPIWTNGQTLGKKMLSLRAVNESGHYLTTGGHLLRGLVGFVLLSLVTSSTTILISAIMVLVTDKRQGIHDFIANSVVISEKPF